MIMTSQGPVSLTSPFGRKVCVCVFDCKSEKKDSPAVRTGLSEL